MAEPTGPGRTAASTPHPKLSEILETRKQIEDQCQQALTRLAPCPPHLHEFWIDLLLSDGWTSKTLVVRPRMPKSDFLDSPRVTTSKTCAKRPMILYFFGGGFRAGSPSQVVFPARRFAEQFQATVLCPNYRLAPEHPWPQAMKDGMEITQIISHNQAYHFGADLTHGFILGGLSSGATIAAVVAGLTTTDPTQYPLTHPLSGIFLSLPFLFVEEILPPEYKSLWTSRNDNRHAEDFNTASIDEMLSTLGCNDYTSPWFSPVNLFSSPDQSRTMSKHPPIYLAANGLDPLRDDAIVYEKMLANAGVRTELLHFPDDGHTSLTSMSVVNSSKSKDPTIEEGTSDGMRWLVGLISVGAKAHHEQSDSYS
ncbi:hypothetical protein LTS08_003564 [Lithohypha guttulata]|nr:hypothetical protein LTS08_003564 [Lithohypha guttulata]